MTVCIAALCRSDSEERAVVAADRMVTLGGFIEFEHAVPKITEESSYAVAMVAGDTLLGTRLVQDVAGALAGSTPPIGEIAQRLATKYEETRRERLEQQILTPRGLNLATFYGNHTTLNPNIVAMIDNQMAQFNLGIELLLAGADTSGAHVYSVLNPGPPELLHDTIGYAAVGSGAIHALQALIGFGHAASADYHETVFRAYVAKRRSEVAPGVGLDTDMAVISDAGIHWLTESELEQLREIHEEYERATSSDLRDRLADFRLGEAGDDETASAGDGDDDGNA